VAGFEVTTSGRFSGDHRGALQKLVEDGKLRADIGMKGLLSFQRNFTWTVINGQCQEVLNRMKTDVG
jgi:hypothetical protein